MYPGYFGGLDSIIILPVLSSLKATVFSLDEALSLLIDSEISGVCTIIWIQYIFWRGSWVVVSSASTGII